MPHVEERKTRLELQAERRASRPKAKARAKREARTSEREKRRKERVQGKRPKRKYSPKEKPAREREYVETDPRIRAINKAMVPGAGHRAGGGIIPPSEHHDKGGQPYRMSGSAKPFIGGVSGGRGEPTGPATAIGHAGGDFVSVRQAGESTPSSRPFIPPERGGFKEDDRISMMEEAEMMAPNPITSRSAANALGKMLMEYGAGFHPQGVAGGESAGTSGITGGIRTGQRVLRGQDGQPLAPAQPRGSGQVTGGGEASGGGGGGPIVGSIDRDKPIRASYRVEKSLPLGMPRNMNAWQQDYTKPRVMPLRVEGADTEDPVRFAQQMLMTDQVRLQQNQHLPPQIRQAIQNEINTKKLGLMEKRKEQKDEDLVRQEKVAKFYMTTAKELMSEVNAEGNPIRTKEEAVREAKKLAGQFYPDYKDLLGDPQVSAGMTPTQQRSGEKHDFMMEAPEREAAMDAREERQKIEGEERGEEAYRRRLVEQRQYDESRKEEERERKEETVPKLSRGQEIGAAADEMKQIMARMASLDIPEGADAVLPAKLPLGVHAERRGSEAVETSLRAAFHMGRGPRKEPTQKDIADHRERMTQQAISTMTFNQMVAAIEGLKLDADTLLGAAESIPNKDAREWAKASIVLIQGGSIKDAERHLSSDKTDDSAYGSFLMMAAPSGEERLSRLMELRKKIDKRSKKPSSPNYRREIYR